MLASVELQLEGVGKGMSEGQRSYAKQDRAALREALEQLGLFEEETLEAARAKRLRLQGQP